MATPPSGAMPPWARQRAPAPDPRLPPRSAPCPWCRVSDHAGGPTGSLGEWDVLGEGLWPVTKHSCQPHCPGTVVWPGSKGGRMGVRV